MLQKLQIISCLKLSIPYFWQLLTKNALVKQYAKLFEYDGVKLTFDDDALDAIAEKAVKHKTGARGLRSIVENIMMDVMYEIPSDDSIVSCRITKASVDGTEKPVVERK